MNIVWVIDSLGLGGAQKHLVQQVRGLGERGHRSRVFCLNDEAHPAHLAALAASGARVKVLGKPRVLTGLAVVEIAAAVRRQRADLVVTTLFVSTVVGRLAAWLAGRPSITCLQARNLNHRCWHHALLRLTAPLCTLTISNSRQALGFSAAHEGTKPSRSHYVPNGVDESAGPSVPPDWIGLGWPQLAGRRVLGSVGRLVPQKGYDVVLAAFARLAPEHADLSLLLIGRGPQAAMLVAQTEALGLGDRVVFAGEHAAAASLLPGLALYIQPSRYEGMPNALMEALAAGVPAVASRVDGIKDLMVDRVHGRLVAPGDEAALVAALRESLADRPQALAMAAQARLAMKRAFRVETMITAYEGHFQSSMGRRSRSGGRWPRWA